MSQPVGYAVAAERINLVVAWYAQELDREAKSRTPSNIRIQRLMEKRRQCIADRNLLRTCGPEEALRLMQEYAEMFRVLTNPS